MRLIIYSCLLDIRNISCATTFKGRYKCPVKIWQQCEYLFLGFFMTAKYLWIRGRSISSIPINSYIVECDEQLRCVFAIARSDHRTALKKKHNLVKGILKLDRIYFLMKGAWMIWRPQLTNFAISHILHPFQIINRFNFRVVFTIHLRYILCLNV
jgi:hypothetical protein